MNALDQDTQKNLKNFDYFSPLLFIVAFLADYYLKKYVSLGTLSQSGDFFELAPHYTTSFFGGFFSDANEWIIQIFFIIITVFLFIFSSLFFFVLRRQDIPRLKYGTVLLATGFFGNILDRVLHGRANNIFMFKFGNNHSFSFNLADLICLVGCGFIFISLLLDYKKIFFHYNIKRKVLIEPKFQIEFSLILVFIGTLNAIMIGIYSYSYLRIYLSQAGYVVLGVNDLLTDYLLGLFIMEVFFLIATFIVGIVFSHKMIGPIQAFEGFVRRLLNNTPHARDKSFKLRQLDYFKNFESLAELMKDKWEKKD